MTASMLAFDDDEYYFEEDRLDDHYDLFLERHMDDFEDDFADPGGVSALRAATPNNPRIHPCPTCGAPNRLTLKDVFLHYQCNSCAERDERGGW